MGKGGLTECFGSKAGEAFARGLTCSYICQGKEFRIASQGTSMAHVRNGAKQGLGGSWSTGLHGGTRTLQKETFEAQGMTGGPHRHPRIGLQKPGVKKTAWEG